MAASRETLFAQADVVSLHLGLNSSTRGSIDSEVLDLMKPTALLANTARAELLAPGALLTALRAGRPAYAALDQINAWAEGRMLNAVNTAPFRHVPE